jgi:hypothetical protein
VGGAERGDDGAGEGGDVDEPLGALADRVHEAVGEHEPPLGLGVALVSGALGRVRTCANSGRASTWRAKPVAR